MCACQLTVTAGSRAGPRGAGPDDLKVSLGFSWLALIKPGGEKEEELEKLLWWFWLLVFPCSLSVSLSLSRPLCSLSVSPLTAWLAEWGTCCVLYGPSVTYSALPSA